MSEPDAPVATEDEAERVADVVWLMCNDNRLDDLAPYIRRILAAAREEGRREECEVCVVLCHGLAEAVEEREDFEPAAIEAFAVVALTIRARGETGGGG